MSNVNLTITSAVGFRRCSTQTLVFPDGTVSVGGYNSPRPLMTTTFTLEGLEQPDIAVTGTRILTLTEPAPFVMYPGQQSPPQQVFLTNVGNSPVSLVFPFFKASRDGVDFPNIDFEPSNGIILPGETGIMTITYTAGDVAGEYYNWIIVVSNANSEYKFLTLTQINDILNYEISPLNFSTVTTKIGQRVIVPYQLIPIFNGEVNTSIEIPFDVSISGHPAWKIKSTNPNGFLLEFESHDANNTNGSYVAGVTITSGVGSYTAINTATINIDYDQNYNIETWTSPISPNNSVIGISYDLIDGEKTLTIGVGMGGDGTPVYDDGGDIFLDIRNLGIGADSIDFPFAHWAEVYRFSNLGTGTAKTYVSGAKDDDGNYIYQKKTSDTYNYSYYFGYERSFGSMFIVEDDGTGSLKISLNNLRETSGDESFDNTLHNLTNAFHYYSLEDIPSRTINLPQYPFSTSTTYPVSTATIPLPPGEARTRMFLGFDVVSTSTFTVATSLVSIPRF